MRRSTSPSALAAGCAVGGLLVGAAEGAYRGVALLYSAMLYGALWSILGLLMIALLSLLVRRWNERFGFGVGLGVSVASSAAVLVRFIVLRDILVEKPGSGLQAALAGLGAATAILVAVFVLARSLRRVFYIDWIPRALGWTIPGLTLAAFALLVRMAPADDNTIETSTTQLKGRGIIVVVVDTLRADALGSYGAPPLRGGAATPHLDAFAARGTLFEDVSAQASWTRPAVASLMTSRHASGHNTMRKVDVLPASLPTLAEVMRDGGFKTAAVVTNFNLEAGYGFDQGFDHYRYLAPARYLGAPERANRLAAYNVYRLLREKFVTAGREARFFYRDGSRVNAAGMELLDTIGNERFFLYLHYMEPHDPYFGPDGSYARVENASPVPELRDSIFAAYRHEVRRFDTFFGELLEALDQRGLADKVDIVFTSDHGEEFQDHGGWWHGETLYEEQIHVPLIAVGPSFTAGVVSDLGRQIDIAPTILAAAGLEAPADWEGQNLLDSQSDVKSSLAEEDHNGNELTSLRRGTHKLITANPDNPRGLQEKAAFDLAIDPDEQEPLSQLPDRLEDDLAAALKSAHQGGARAEEREMTAEQEAELRAIGYME